MTQVKIYDLAAVDLCSELNARRGDTDGTHL